MKTGSSQLMHGLILLMMMILAVNLMFADVTDVSKELKEKQKAQIMESEKKNDPQSFMLEKDKVTDEQKRHEMEVQRMNLCIQKINNFLISKGYQTDNAPFKMKFKNIMKFKFKNKAYLNNKRLPKEVSKEVFKLYYETCKQVRTKTLNLPEGLKLYDECPEQKD
ncbi:MAG TPA: hypothetical protein PKJ08_07880 [Candidatus Cloacimonadota bacterium]|jgi:hypothetical protein|nr:hypothetical protein [Candidatus Cloacimonadota bacterium]HOD54430.1 hypothetical protein [Candidatus Cloacimonadota bacterium]HPM00882.1 hypothetical protein [Candidatus Cloacimonadota bacterium]